MTYCGCGTKSNRLKWALAILFTILGLVLIAAAIGTAAKDINKYDDCLKVCLNSGEITTAQYDDNKDGPKFNDNQYANTGIPCVDDCQRSELEDNASTWGGLFWAGVAALVIASIPCYIMCCCTSRPDSVHGHPVAVAYTNGAPVATPYQAAGQYQTSQPNAYAYPPSAAPDPYASAAPPNGYPTNQYNYGKV